MNFENVKCDGCGEKIEQDQDVVVCPECGTPQHRQCYEERGCCVNAEKHANGYLWKDEKQKTEDKKSGKYACPNCGTVYENEDAVCPKCGFDRKKAQEDFIARQQSERQQLSDLMQQNENGELPNLDKLIDFRVNAVAPGITQEQRKEQLCGHDIGTTASFIANAVSSYIKKFRAIEHENKRTFNWGAFFFAPYWFFWRKLYKEGIAVLGISIILDLLYIKPGNAFYQMASEFANSAPGTQLDVSAFFKAAMPIYILGGLMLIMKIVIGFTADRLYHKYCTSCLNELDRLKAQGNDEAVTYYVKRSGISIMFAVLSVVIYYVAQYILASFIV